MSNTSLLNAKKYLKEYITKGSQTLLQQTIESYETFLNQIDIREYHIRDINETPLDTITESLFNLGNLYVHKSTQAPDTMTSSLFQKAIVCYKKILSLKIEDTEALKQIVSVYTKLCFISQHDYNVCLGYLQEALVICPTNDVIHYNLGHVYLRLNNVSKAIVHYKLSLALTDASNVNLQLNNYNGLANAFRNIQAWPEAYYYLQKAVNINNTDPDIQNQLGIVTTEMRRTDLAENAYITALKHYKQSFISTDTMSLLADIYLNYGHMHSYNGDNIKAIDCYNNSLIVKPTYRLPFGNKVMNLNYLFDELEDKMYITAQHKLVNKIYIKNKSPFSFPLSRFQENQENLFGYSREQWDSCLPRTKETGNMKEYGKVPCKINIGIMSGDFVNHPVSYFINTFLENYDSSKFNVVCYYESTQLSIFNSKRFTIKCTQNLSANVVANVIYNDNIHILIDLAGHTARNRLDVFALKPAPIQITYIGYPFTTGLDEMDYRITDFVCDNPEVSQKFYTEKLLYMPNCFLCYNSPIVPNLSEQPIIQNGYLTIGCFNRLNKISNQTIRLINCILQKNPKIKILFKTKALLNKKVQEQFLNKFDNTLLPQIKIVECTIDHYQHLLQYNNIDIALDTFPYSGTTTSCEALLMGVPVFSVYDSKHFFHAQNVTSSILKNSNLDFYVLNKPDDIHAKIEYLINQDSTTWKLFKENTRRNFLNGKVCDKISYTNHLTNLLQKVFVNYKSKVIKSNQK